MSRHQQSNGKPNGALDAGLRARIQESHERAKFVLEASKLALDAQSQQLTRPERPARLDISNLFGHQSYTLPSQGPRDRSRKSVSPRHSFDPNDDMQSTRKTIEPEEENRPVLKAPSDEYQGRSIARNRFTLSPREMANRSGARAVAASLNGVDVQDLTVTDILANSRSERVRRLSQAPTADSMNFPAPTNSRSKAARAAVAMFEEDEHNFIAEIPMGFQPASPPTCQIPPSRKKGQLLTVDSAKIPIQLDDFGGEGYLLRNDFSFNQMCNKASNRTDSICVPLERNTAPAESFYSNKDDSRMTSFNASGGQPIRSLIPNETTMNAKLKGGNMDGAVCMDCSKKCKCDNDNDLVEKIARKEREIAERKRLEDMMQREKDEAADCRIMEDRNKCLKIECVEQNNCGKKDGKEKKMDFCDQHMSYLDRVMKHLDICKDSNKEQKKCMEKERACKDPDFQVVAARKAKSMVSSDCCGTENDDFSNNINTCCANDEKAMSVCSQGFTGRDGDIRRAQSQMSSTSDFNFVNGYLPLKSTHNEISWPSVKLRKSQTKSFQIKNTSPKRLIIRVILDGPGFNFENVEANSRGTLTLQPNEVRTLQLIFNPTVLGPAIGNLIFQPPIEYCAAGGGCATMSTINSPVTKRVVRLYGYGGHVAMSFERLQQGPVGTKFLPLGNLCNLNKVFEEVFIIRNKGNLTGFAAAMLENKTVGKSMFDHAISVCPDKVLIPANSAVKVKVTFQPTGSDMREMMKIHRNQEVISIGNILVVTGDEPTRCRIKRLISGSKDLAAKYSSAQLMNIWADYGNSDCDYDLSELRETGLAVADLMGSFTSKEVALTVNNSTTDMSLIDASGWISDVEDSDALFHTICQPGENSDCCISPPDNDANMMPLEVTRKAEEGREDPCQPDQWYVTPGSLTFNTNSVLPQVLSIHSKTSKNRMFEVDSNVANYFCVSPQEGVLTPSCDTTNISVRMMNYNVPDCQLFIYIYVENDRICVPVCIIRGPPEGKATCPKISSEKVANLA